MERLKARHEIDKKKGVRQLLHCAIRMYFSFEDQYAIHLIVRSASRVIKNLAKADGRKLMYDDEQFVRPERISEYRNIMNQLENYLKHADNDPKDKLPIFEIGKLNTLLLWKASLMYAEQFHEKTTHIQLFKVVASVLLHEYISNLELKKLAMTMFYEYDGRRLDAYLRDMYSAFALANVELEKERDEDLQDATYFFQQNISTFKKA